MNLFEKEGPVSPHEFVAEYRLQFKEGGVHILVYDRGSSVPVRATWKKLDESVNMTIGRQRFKELIESDLAPLREMKTIEELCTYVHEQIESEQSGYSCGSTTSLILYAFATSFQDCVMRKVIAMPDCTVTDLTSMAQEALKHGLPN